MGYEDYRGLPKVTCIIYKRIIVQNRQLPLKTIEKVTNSTNVDISSDIGKQDKQ